MNTLASAVLLLVATLPAIAAAQEGPTIVAPTPPADTSPDRDRSAVENIARYSDHGKLEAAIEASGLAGALQSNSPLTIFAPTDSAFSSMVNADYDELLNPENRDKLAELLRYHVVVGLLDTATLTAKIEAGGGSARLETMQGGTLVVTKSGDEFTVTDANHTARITAADRYQRNGVVQVVDRVLMSNTQ